MRKAVRAIIIENNNLLVMARNKFGNKYVTLPGGGIEPGESPQHAVVREVMEETTVAAKDPVLRYIEHAGDPYGDQYTFSLTYVGGSPKLMPGSQEDHINKLGKNMYEPFWMPLADLEKTPFVSEYIKQHLLNDLPNNLPKEVVEFTWN